MPGRFHNLNVYMPNYLCRLLSLQVQNLIIFCAAPRRLFQFSTPGRSVTTTTDIYHCIRLHQVFPCVAPSYLARCIKLHEPVCGSPSTVTRIGPGKTFTISTPLKTSQSPSPCSEFCNYCIHDINNYVYGLFLVLAA